MGSESRHPLPSPLWTHQTTLQEATTICIVDSIFQMLGSYFSPENHGPHSLVCFLWAHPLTCRGSALKWTTNRLLTYRFVMIIYDHTRIRFYTTSVIDRGSLNNSGMDSFILQWLFSHFLSSRCFFFFQFRNPVHTIRRTSLTGDRPVARLLPHRHRINEHRHSCLEWDWNSRPELSSWRRQFMP
jgi:hypothetical protein